MTILYDSGKNEYKNWVIKEGSFDQKNLNKYESIFTLGNGYLGLRSATEERYIGENRGLYLAGTFDKFADEVTELPNLPDPLMTEIKINGERLDLSCDDTVDYSRSLNLKNGELTRKFIWEDSSGKRTSFCWKRIVSMADKHLIFLKLEIEPLNYSGEVEILSGINGQVTNSGVQHFVEKDLRFLKDDSLYYLTAKTQESGFDIAVAGSHKFWKNGETFKPETEISTGRRKIAESHKLSVESDSSYVFEKKIFICSNRDDDLEFDEKEFNVDQLHNKLSRLSKKYRGSDYDEQLELHQAKWSNYWDEMDIEIEGVDFDQLAIRFALFHLIQMTPHHDERLSIAAKGMTGEGYKGHVFWDMETFIMPFFIHTFPDKAKQLLKYRYHTLDGARKKAASNGYEGAMYAWESALTGEETTPKFGAVDVKTGESIRIWCGEIEHHITADVAKAVFDYNNITGDYGFIEDYGAEMLIEMARYWSTRLEYNNAEDIYEINNVIGPDEYSEHIDNNAYTNYMVYWQLKNTADLIENLKVNSNAKYKLVKDKLDFEIGEVTNWRKIADKIKLPEPDEDGIIPQFDGFMDKKDYDLSKFEGEVGSIVSELGWEEVNEHKIIKQADVVMLMHQLDDYFDDEIKQANYEYYEPKTLHDSSLSPAIHSTLAAQFDHLEEAYKLFERAARIDLGENMNSSDPGIHSASLGGLWQAIVFGFAGLKTEKDEFEISPDLPEKWKSLRFKFYWQGDQYLVDIDESDNVVKKLNNK